MTWTFSPTARPIRFYLWLYGASMDGINFCKLFWGFLFSPIALPVRLFAGTKVASSMAQAIERKADAAVGVTQRHPWMKQIKYVVLGLEGLWLLAFLGWGIYEWVHYPMKGLVIVACVLGGLTLLVGILVGIAWFSTTETAETFGEWCKRCWFTFIRFLESGYHHIKERTCPRVVISQNTRSLG